MAKQVSCGVILFRNPDAPEFLLMKHRDRWDLPKGHVDPGETELECAFREMEEETGILRGLVQLDSAFRFDQEYMVTPPTGKGQVPKRLVIFLGWISGPVEIRLTEHIGFKWFDWKPPHQIQKRTIDPLLAAVEKSKVIC
jgi:8-oxo-dGTP pyrophosphatase MutT (NUDIX family)